MGSWGVLARLRQVENLPHHRLELATHPLMTFPTIGPNVSGQYAVTYRSSKKFVSGRVECGAMRTGADGWCLRGWLVAELRQARGKSQEALAEEVGCSRSTVAMWESRNQRPGPRLLPRLARGLGVAPLDLIELVGSEWTLRLLRRLLGYTQAQVARVLRVAVSTYCDVERGRQDLPDRWVPVLAALFNTDEQTIRNSAPFKKAKKR